MKLQSVIFTSVGILVTSLPVILFRSPANTVRSGNILSALSWQLAENRGDGSWELYPMTFTVEIGDMVTFARIENCGSTSRPDLRLPDQIPFPLDYTQADGIVSIIFSEVP